MPSDCNQHLIGTILRWLDVHVNVALKKRKRKNGKTGIGHTIGLQAPITIPYAQHLDVRVALKCASRFFAIFRAWGCEELRDGPKKVEKKKKEKRKKGVYVAVPAA